MGRPAYSIIGVPLTKGHKIKQFKTLAETVEKMKLSYYSIEASLRISYLSAGNYKWFRKSVYEALSEKARQKMIDSAKEYLDKEKNGKKHVVCMLKNGKSITYNSVSEASLDTGVSYNVIYNAINNKKSHYAAGCKWYKKQDYDALMKMYYLELM